MIDLKSVVTTLQNSGFRQSHETSKLIQFNRGSQVVYVKRLGTDRPLVIHGDNAGKFASFLAISGVVREKPSSEPYHNSNMRAFAERRNTGLRPTRFGYDFGFENQTSLETFLNEL